MSDLALNSYAKINLALYVLRKREDGFHEIFTIMQAIDLCDRLIFSVTPQDIKVECDDPLLPVDERNLAYQAAEALFRKKKIKGGIKIKIEKKIPMGAGLGGGSSNAAFTLKGLNRLFDLKLSLAELHQIATDLGSDVPFFLYSGQAVATGRGERIKPVSLPTDYSIILVYPKFEIPTWWAYENVKISLTNKSGGIHYYISEKNEFLRKIVFWKNDLEKGIIKTYPVIDNIKESLSSWGAIKTSMSGSGPTVYGIFDSNLKAEEVAKRLKRGDWQIFFTRPIPLE